MKIYFSASLSRYRGLLPLTKDIARIIEDLGHEVISKHVIKEETTDEVLRIRVKKTDTEIKTKNTKEAEDLELSI
jgi:hypothetical protein